MAQQMARIKSAAQSAFGPSFLSHMLVGHSESFE